VADDAYARHGGDVIRRVGVTLDGVSMGGRPAVVDAGSKSELLEDPDGVPVAVDFIPLQAVSGRNRVGVMVVVLTITETHHCHPPIVG